MKKAAIIATLVATPIFLFSSYLLLFHPVARSTRDGILLFNFAMWYAIPGLLWLIYFFTKKK